MLTPTPVPAKGSAYLVQGDATAPKFAPVTSLFNYFGSNRKLAPHVGEALAGRNHVTVLFAGGMCEVPYIKARSIIVNDLHRHVVNAAWVAADPNFGPQMYRELRRKIFSPDMLTLAQLRCRDREGNAFREREHSGDDRLWWAVDYFVTSWMGQGGRSGTAKEFNGCQSIRWDAGGGDSAKRFASAVAGLPAWRRTLARCTFTHRDFRDVLDDVKDVAECGVYADPPFPGPGKDYLHTFTESDHRQLAARLGSFQHNRVVVRYYRHPLIEELYQLDKWNWTQRESRTQANKAAADCLIVNRSSLTPEAAPC